MNKEKKYKLLMLIILISFNFNIYCNFTIAQTTSLVQDDNLYSISRDKLTTENIISSHDSKIKIIFPVEYFSSSTTVEIKELNENIETPWQLDKVGMIYQFDILNKKTIDIKKSFKLRIFYTENNNLYKNIFFFDKSKSLWKPLPSKDNQKEKFVECNIALPFAQLAIFSYPDILTKGDASWYKFKYKMTAASPDFPINSRLRVYNLENNKFVDITVKDYGPDRNIHPTRVVDLEKTAFSKLATTNKGTIKVYVEPLYIPITKNKTTLGISNSGVKSAINIGTKSAVIFDENSSKILWSKKATSTQPLASLSKMVAIKVFLDTKPSLNTVVSYKKQDEEYNYKYCEKWESAKLKVNEGETLTIENLVYSALVGSANNAVESLARVSGLSRENFIDRMNEIVKEWGASTTHFIEPTGLSPENVSSVLDYAIITKEVLKNPIIVKASTAKTYKFTTINTKKAHTIKNTNYIIQNSNYNITGSKTGYLEEAGYCLMTRVKKKTGGNIIVVTFGSDTRDINFNETTELIKYGLRLATKI
jgi:serine-type D-Ala-D-Ala endopeptidase (penicillin-binding protein 7)